MFTEEELKTMDDYREYYALSSEASTTSSFSYIPSIELLKPWMQAKGDHLFKLFGDKLILKKNLSFSKNRADVEDELTEMCNGNSYGRSHPRVGKTFIDAYEKTVKELYFRTDYITYTKLISLVSAEALYENTVYIAGSPVSIPLPNGKEYKITNGTKIMKVLSKLTSIWDLPGFEDFRICHSQIFNTKDKGGEVVLSIHPLDYMTMSDNDCDWNSCMSWRDEGGYRQGTVEMMNSPCVVVAYIEDKRPMRIYPNHKWNNKRWRELFIVDKNMISEVKAYSYEYKELSAAIVEWLKELAKENLGWEYGKTDLYDSTAINGIISDQTIYIELWSDNMYDDLASRSFHAAFKADLQLEDLNGRNLEIDYSGPSQCMICGKINPALYDQSCLACLDCQVYEECDLCGDTGEDFYDIDGEHLCESCYYDRVMACPICNEEHIDDNMESINIVPNYTPEEMKENKEWLDSKNKFITLNPDYNQCVQLSIQPEVYCCNDCKDRWEEKYLKPGREPHGRRYGIYKIQDCVFFDDLNELGVDEYLDGMMNEQFKNHLGQYSMRYTQMVY